MQYMEIFVSCKKLKFQWKKLDMFNIVAQNLVRMSTHSIYFESKIRNIVYPYKPHFHHIKVGFKEVFFARTCFCDVYGKQEDLEQTKNWVKSHLLFIKVIIFFAHPRATSMYITKSFTCNIQTLFSAVKAEYSI